MCHEIGSGKQASFDYSEKISPLAKPISDLRGEVSQPVFHRVQVPRLHLRFYTISWQKSTLCYIRD